VSSVAERSPRWRDSLDTSVWHCSLPALNSVNPASKSATAGRRKSARQKQSHADRAYLEVRNNILKGNLPVGMAISRRKLATELHISVPPVTEALLRLEGEGLIESKPRVGTRVRIPTRQDVEDRSILREALEVQAARLFAERALPSERKELQKIGQRVDRLYGAYEKGPADREFLFSVNSCHMSLHLRIAECARCQALREAIEKEQVLIFNWLHDIAVQRRTLSSDYHTSLTAALAAGSPAKAESAMRHHIRHGLSEVIAGLEHIGREEGPWRSKNAQPPPKSANLAGIGSSHYLRS
jgi:DNA-binding GntR family transcriptional regulator